MHAMSQVLFASRIPVNLKQKLFHFCSGHGIKMNFFVSQAIQEKLERIAEDEADVSLVLERQKNAEFISQKEMDLHFKKRFVKH